MANELMAKDFRIVCGQQDEYAAEMAEEMEGIQIRYPRLKIPSSGSLTFEIATDDPDKPEYTTTVRGVILHHNRANAYWANPDMTQGQAPDCSSVDGKSGKTADGEWHNCDECPFNQFGSKEGGQGKACKNMEYVYILRDGAMLPTLLALPPTSIRSYHDYMNYLVQSGLLARQVVTEISLRKQQGNGKNTYSVAVFKSAGRIGDEHTAAIRSMQKTIKAAQAQNTPAFFDEE